MHENPLNPNLDNYHTNWIHAQHMLDIIQRAFISSVQEHSEAKARMKKSVLLSGAWFVALINFHFTVAIAKWVRTFFPAKIHTTRSRIKTRFPLNSELRRKKSKQFFLVPRHPPQLFNLLLSLLCLTGGVCVKFRIYTFNSFAPEQGSYTQNIIKSNKRSGSKKRKKLSAEKDNNIPAKFFRIYSLSPFRLLRRFLPLVFAAFCTQSGDVSFVMYVFIVCSWSAARTL